MKKHGEGKIQVTTNNQSESNELSGSAESKESIMSKRSNRSKVSTCLLKINVIAANVEEEPQTVFD